MNIPAALSSLAHGSTLPVVSGTIGLHPPVSGSAGSRIRASTSGQAKADPPFAIKWHWTGGNWKVSTLDNLQLAIQRVDGWARWRTPRSLYVAYLLLDEGLCLSQSLSAAFAC